MTSFLHIGDTHAQDRADVLAALDAIIAFGAQQPQLGAWLWPGDLGHTALSIADKNALAERVQRMAGVAPVVICAGNHDAPGDLDIFARLDGEHPIHVVTQPRVLSLPLPTGERASIFVLPYPHKAGLVAAGTPPADVPTVAAAALDAIFMHAAGELAAARARGDLTLMIGHANVGGAITASGQPNIGREIELAPQHLDRLGFIYKGLNHIHVAQEIHGAHYAGSICRLDWGEIDPKSFMVVSYDAARNILLSRVPLDVPPMYHVEGELTRDGFTWTVQAGPGGRIQEAPATWDGCRVRVRYRFHASEKAVLDHASVVAPFAGALEVKPDPIAVPDRALRSPEVAQALTLQDKVAAWCGVAGHVASAGVLAKLAQLETLDRAALLAAVQAQVAPADEGMVA